MSESERDPEDEERTHREHDRSAPRSGALAIRVHTLDDVEVFHRRLFLDGAVDGARGEQRVRVAATRGGRDDESPALGAEARADGELATALRALHGLTIPPTVARFYSSRFCACYGDTR